MCHAPIPGADYKTERNGPMNSKRTNTEGTLASRLLHYRMNGIPLYLYVVFSVPILIAAGLGVLGTDLMSIIGLLFVIGVFCSWLGEKLPIWNTWIGGGSMMAMMLPSFLVYANVIPEKYTESITYFYDDMSFLNFYIIFLITGGLLTIDRNSLLKTLKRCGPVFLGAVIGAVAFGLLGGAIFGKPVGETLAYYVLPNLGGGNGSGAVPMSQIFEQVTGDSGDVWYSTAVAILTLGSTIALVIGVILNRIGQIFPQFAGDGKSLLRSSANIQLEEEEEYVPTAMDKANAVLLAAAFWALATLFGEKLLPTIFGVIIHPFAYLILFLTIANVLNVIPKNLRFGAEAMSDFISGKMGPMLFAGLGVAMLDFSDFLGAITFENLIISLLLILGVAVGSGIMGVLVGFYPIDAIIVAGLTCSNRGDSADVILLTATNRMALIPYASAISKLGGAVVLALSSMVFTTFFT